MRTPIAGLTALLLAVVLAGCGDDEPRPQPGRAATTTTAGAPSSSSPTAAEAGETYVALGDSYSAAPGVPPAVADSGGCFRSGANYAALLAADEGLDLTDETCSGATTSDVVEKQASALSPDTDLVTVGIGGNDFDLFVQLVTACVGATVACSEVAGERVSGVLPRIETNIGKALDAVTEAAPQAQVVVVGYPDLLPDAGACPDRLPLTRGDFAFVDGVVRDLSSALQRQAEKRDLDFVDVYAASQGHDVCADDPWINGAETSPEGVIPLHPLPAEQRAVADLIAPLLR